MTPPATARSKPAVGYLRRSTDRQDQSLGDQRKAIEAYAERQGFKMLEYFTDDAISGASSEGRDAFQRMIAAAQTRTCSFKHVLVYDIKRFGRVDNDEAGHYRYQLRKNGVEIVYVSEGFDGSDTDDLLRPVKQWQARNELLDLSKVTTRGLISRADGGWRNGGMAPYGYDTAHLTSTGEFICTVRFESDGSRTVLDEAGLPTRTVPAGDALLFSKKDRSRLVLSHPTRVDIVRQIFQWYVQEGLGYKGIADRLNRMNIPSPTSRRANRSAASTWTHGTVAGILNNPNYTGDLHWNRLTFGKFHKIVGHYATRTTGLPTGGYKKNDEIDWIVTPNTHEPIITHPMYEQAALRKKMISNTSQSRSFNSGRGASSDFLLTGLIKCARCGHNFQGYSVNKGRKRLDGSNVKTLYYACWSYVSKGSSVCPRRVVSKIQLEEYVIAQVEFMLAKYLESPSGQTKLRQALIRAADEQIPSTEAESRRLQSRRDQIERMISSLIENLTPTNREFVDIKLVELKQEMELIAISLRSLIVAEEQRQEVEKQLEQAYRMAAEFRLTFEKATVEEKRILLRSFVKEIMLDPITSKGKATFVLMPSSIR